MAVFADAGRGAARRVDGGRVPLRARVGMRRAAIAMLLVLGCGGPVRGDGALSSRRIAACAPHLSSDRDGVDYFSAEGRRIAACLHIPGPPRPHVMRLARIDPDRTMPANLWRAPFCTAWQDQTLSCRRDKGHVTCAPYATAPDEYRPGKVVCTETNSDVVASYCSDENFVMLYKSKSDEYKETSGAESYVTSYSYDIGAESPKWMPDWGEYTSLMRGGPSDFKIGFMQDERCVKGHTKHSLKFFIVEHD